MKTLTRKQREKIYLQIAEKIESRIDGNYAVCLSLLSEIGYIQQFEDLQFIFPEFYLLRRYSNTASGLWWRDSKGGNYCRILALLLSAEMTKTEKL